MPADPPRARSLPVRRHTPRRPGTRRPPPLPPDRSARAGRPRPGLTRSDAPSSEHVGCRRVRRARPGCSCSRRSALGAAGATGATGATGLAGRAHAWRERAGRLRALGRGPRRAWGDDACAGRSGTNEATHPGAITAGLGYPGQANVSQANVGQAPTGPGGSGSLGLGPLARGLFTPAVPAGEPTPGGEPEAHFATQPHHTPPHAASPHAASPHATATSGTAQPVFPAAPPASAPGAGKERQERSSVPAPHQLYGASAVAPAVDGGGSGGAPIPVAGAAVPVRAAEPEEPFPVPARPAARSARGEQSEPVDPPAKATSRRAAARTPRARKAVEPVSGEGAGMHGGDGSAA